MAKENIRTTGVKAESYEAGLKHLREFAVTNHGASYCYALLMEEEDGTYRLYERVRMPCWGALREYSKGNRPKDNWPWDLREAKHIFPKTGKVSAIAACFTRNISNKGTHGYVSVENWNTFIDFCFNPETSPWKKVLLDFELVKNEDGAYFGVVFNNTKFDPNIMISLLRTNVLSSSKALNFSQFLKKHPSIDPRVAYLKCINLDGYYMWPSVILKDWFLGEPTSIPMEGTFYDRTSYNRPYISHIFGGKNGSGEVVSRLSIDDLTEALNDAVQSVIKREQDELESGDIVF